MHQWLSEANATDQNDQSQYAILSNVTNMGKNPEDLIIRPWSPGPGEQE